MIQSSLLIENIKQGWNDGNDIQDHLLYGKLFLRQVDICEIICLMILIVADAAVVAISACLDLLSIPFPSNYNNIEFDPQINFNIITINSYF